MQMALACREGNLLHILVRTQKKTSSCRDYDSVLLTRSPRIGVCSHDVFLSASSRIAVCVLSSTRSLKYAGIDFARKPLGVTMPHGEGAPIMRL